MIIEKDFSWLEEKVPDMRLILEKFDPLFKLGGFVAGGSLRSAIQYSSMKKALVRTPNTRHGDIDFFFPDKDDAVQAAVDVVNLANGVYKEPELYMNQKVGWSYLYE